MATYQHVTLYSPHRRLRLGAHIRACAPENRISSVVFPSVFVCSTLPIRRQSHANTCLHHSQPIISAFTTPTLLLRRHSSTASHQRCRSILSTEQTPTACRKNAYTTLADHLKFTCESLAISTCYRHTAAVYNQGTIEVRWRLDQNNNNTIRQ